MGWIALMRLAVFVKNATYLSIYPGAVLGSSLTRDDIRLVVEGGHEVLI
jgi:hypothetical protein